MKSTDVFVIGGGPAGLAAALAARRYGLSVVVADPARPPIDKACGEGLLPTGVVALANLGVPLSAQDGAVFTGIRFSGGGRSVDGHFPQGVGIGIRRTHLHLKMAEQAEAAGVDLLWGAHAALSAAHRGAAGGQEISFRYLVGADGANSTVRRWARLNRLRTDRLRFGFRRHYDIAPWSEFVEVYWTPGCQAYVTPVAADRVCVAILTRDPHQRLSPSLARFPELENRLRAARGVGLERGSPSYSRRLYRVAAGNVALVGDASGSVDAVTGEGMSLAFRQAEALGAALALGDLSPYVRAHQQLRRVPEHMASLMLLMDQSGLICRRTLNALSARPSVFRSLLAHQVGANSAPSFARAAGALVWSLVSA